jgi:hypothetical protein
MPVVRSGNTRILPSNDRSVDIAKRTIKQVMGIQQKRYDNAFMVQGYECLVYNLLDAGRPCSCAAKHKALAGRLDQDGKLSNGDINNMITNSMEFKVTPYGQRPANTPTWSEINELAAHPRGDLVERNAEDVNQQEPPLEYIDTDAENPAVNTVEPDGDTFGVNGPVQGVDTIADIEDTDFDPENFELNDVACPICMGTSYVGGVSLLGGWRRVLVPHDTDFETDGTFDSLSSPLRIEGARWLRQTFVFPRGCWLIDSLKVWDTNQRVHGTMYVDDMPVAQERDFLRYCDGKRHTLMFVFANTVNFTHVEIQVALSDKASLIEFPRLGQSGDPSKIDNTDDVQILASPEIPIVRRKDLIVESSFGKMFQIMNCQLWNDKDRSVLGWDMNARVVQPQELYSLLPRRKVLKQKTTFEARNNNHKL